MKTNLKLVKAAPAAEMQKVGINPAGRETDAAYGRDAQKYLRPWAAGTERVTH
jgi:hypothetical protein